MKLKYDSEDYFTLPLGTFLTSRGIAVTDLTEAIVMVKDKVTDADEDAVVTRSIGVGVAISEEDNTMVFNF